MVIKVSTIFESVNVKVPLFLSDSCSSSSFILSQSIAGSVVEIVVVTTFVVLAGLVVDICPVVVVVVAYVVVNSSVVVVGSTILNLVELILFHFETDVRK